MLAKRHGLVFLVTLILIPIVGKTAQFAYTLERNSDRGFDSAMLSGQLIVAIIFITGIVTAAAIVLFAKAREQEEIGSFLFLLVLWLFSLVTIKVASWKGECIWVVEYNETKALANQLVQKLNNHLDEHGSFPATLKEVKSPSALTPSNGKVVELHYEAVNQGRFVLRYSYGWYRHEFDSEKSSWVTKD